MSVFCESDFLKLENLGMTYVAAKRWKNATRNSRIATRVKHRSFVWKVYSIALGLLIVGVVQWDVWNSNKDLIAELEREDHFILPVLIFLNFLLILFIGYILHGSRNRSKYAIALYVFVLMEFSSALLCLPLARSMTKHLVKASSFTFLATAICVTVASVYHFQMEQEHLFLTQWGVKYFLITAICIHLAQTFESNHAKMSMALVLLFFILIFSIIFARSLGSMEFFRFESDYIALYITLMYLVLLSIFANALVFFSNLVEVRETRAPPPS